MGGDRRGRMVVLTCAPRIHIQPGQNMLSLRSVRYTALVAAALTFAACGSDKATGPTTANNEAIIADLQDAYDASGGIDGDESDKLLALSFGITALSLGSPVSSGTVTIDNTRYPFSFTSFSLQVNEAEGVSNSVSIVVGWRHSNGDSLVAMIYASEGFEIPALRGATPVGASQLRAPGSTRLADVARMLRSGKVSREIASGSLDLHVAAFVAGDEVWRADLGSGVLHSGSISATAATGDCDDSGLPLVGAGESIVSCEMQRSNFAAGAELVHLDSEDEDGRALTLDAQAVTGAKVMARLIEE